MLIIIINFTKAINFCEFYYQIEMYFLIKGLPCGIAYFLGTLRIRISD